MKSQTTSPASHLLIRKFNMFRGWEHECRASLYYYQSPCAPRSLPSSREQCRRIQRTGNGEKLCYTHSTCAFSAPIRSPSPSLPPPVRLSSHSIADCHRGNPVALTADRRIDGNKYAAIMRGRKSIFTLKSYFVLHCIGLFSFSTRSLDATHLSRY